MNQSRGFLVLLIAMGFELPLVGVLEERLESSAAPGGTRFLISIFLDQLPALVTIDEGAKQIGVEIQPKKVLVEYRASMAVTTLC